MVNIDHDPSSTSAHDSFHGPGISLFQHPDTNFSEVPQVVVTMLDEMATTGTIHVACLPETYTSIPPATLARKGSSMPKQEGANKAVCQLIPEALQKEYK